MSMLVFFPWLKMSGQGEIANIRLIEYRRGELPAGSGTALQQEIDSVLEPYRTHRERAIEAATILALDEEGLTRELKEEEINRIFVFAELLAFSGLATREFFDQFVYSNRDLFQVVVQRYEKPTGGVTLRYRRRDGITTDFVSREVFAIERPGHIYVPFKARIDIPLLSALVQAHGQFEHELWNSYFEAIVNYGIANRDSPDLTLQMEAILMACAFERLFDLRRGKEDELAEKFGAAMQPTQELTASACARFATLEAQSFLQKHHSVRNAWIRDFFRLRGNLAHGLIAARYRSRWSLQEHLLLGSYAFPLVVKWKLFREGVYTLTDQDRDDIDMFEHLACAQLLTNLSSELTDVADIKFPWNEVRGKFRFERMMTRAMLDRTKV